MIVKLFRKSMMPKYRQPLDITSICVSWVHLGQSNILSLFHYSRRARLGWVRLVSIERVLRLALAQPRDR